MLPGQMMNRPLLISSLIEYAAEIFSSVEIVSATVEGGIHRYTYGQAAKRIRQLADALVAHGIKPGDRVATLAWNGYRHYELYYAISGIGAVCHTINPRLSGEQIAYIVNHAQSSALFFDLTFTPLVEKLAPALKPVRSYFAMTDRSHMPAAAGGPRLLCYEELLASGAGDIRWPEFDENTACGLCYTSGTTGEPKGALYSHRSSVLHAFMSLAGNPRCFGPEKPLLPVVPLFHVNAWGLPYTTALSGTPLVFPGPKLDGASLFALMDQEQVYSAWGVPTVWLGLLGEVRKLGRKPAGFTEVLTGGAAAPRSMIETFERDLGVNVIHGWGMTEMSPVGSLTRLNPDQERLPFEKRVDIKTRQGRRLYGVEMKIVDDAGRELPKDGEATGELFVRGPAIISGYYNNPEASAKAFDKEGWFGTGDVAKLTPDGFLIIVDRTKDLVKSGGEWISSIDVENVAMGQPGIANCAVIGVPHPKWSERPVLVAVKAAGADPKKEDILAGLAKKLAKYQVPDDVIFIDALPMTATGKVSKRELRARFQDHKLPE